MKYVRRIALLLTASLLLTACSQFTSEDCPPNAIIEWVDMVMINDVKYQSDLVENSPDLKVEIGKELGKVSYKMADKACSNHKMKNGDASYLSVGTPIYEVKGYPPSLMVVARDRVFVVDENKDAKKVQDLYPIKGLVQNIHFQSEEDGRRIHTFSIASTEDFLKEWLTLDYIDPSELYKKQSFEGERLFLEVELKNGVSFRIVYWPSSNLFSFGAMANEQTEEIILREKALMAK